MLVAFIQSLSGFNCIRNLDRCKVHNSDDLEILEAVGDWAISILPFREAEMMGGNN